ncbi:MAG TPA: hypothetical protein VMV93_14535 [Chloroflexota bacterium]|nr:hypothetical protein [Chloroflexota bacterium]
MVNPTVPRELRPHDWAGYWYALVFLLIFAVTSGVFLLFLYEGWALIHVPNISLPNLGFSPSALFPPSGK